MSDSNGHLEDLPVIVAFVENLFFSSRVEAAASQSGFQVNWLEGDMLEAAAANLNTNQDDSLEQERYDSLLLDHITRIRPALIIIDLNHRVIPWYRWIGVLKSSPATRRIPILCFGAHLDRSALTRARAVGADVVLAREKFVQSLPELILTYSRVIDMEAIAASCEEPFSKIGLEGIEEFNRGKYFEAHELLEAAWNLDASAGRELYRAILQVAVAYYQIERGNYRGAIKMFLRLRQWIDPLPERCRGIDVAQLRADAERVYFELVTLGTQQIKEFDRSYFRPVVFTS